MSKTITINEDEFIDIMAKTSAELANGLDDVLKFAIFCGEVHKALFGDDEDTEAPLKSGDAVFVTDNEGDGNTFVNQIVKVLKVDNQMDLCVVGNEHKIQDVYFKNLRKVKTP